MRDREQLSRMLHAKSGMLLFLCVYATNFEWAYTTTTPKRIKHVIKTGIYVDFCLAYLLTDTVID